MELASPGQDEERLQQISQLFSLVFDQGIQTLQESPYQIRRWLKSYNPHVFFPWPFSQLQKPGTRYRYQRQWQCFLCFCFQTSTFGGVSEDRPSSYARGWATIPYYSLHRL